ncbi:MAG: ribosomal RNA small subunit methyltransferase A [Chloroflexi bacterium]|nr:ribosomal RNA small subunit methyltransferase A [Chloroflexota bacterium]
MRTLVAEGLSGASGPSERLLRRQVMGLLTRYGLSPRKGLGQHFLVSEGALRAAVQAADLSPKDVVVEVGPGLGLLTRRLAEAAGRVVAVELDERMVALLQVELRDLPNVTVVHGDILERRPEDLTGDADYKVVANLPYFIASAVVRRFLEAAHRPRRMVVMVQREVAREMTAHPGSFGLLALSVQVYGRPSLVRHVPPGAFLPPPKVESAIVLIDVYPQPRVEQALLPQFFFVARAGFSAPRKQVRNSLAQGLRVTGGDAHSFLEAAEIDSRRRAETLSVEEWERLARQVPVQDQEAAS